MFLLGGRCPSDPSAASWSESVRWNRCWPTFSLDITSTDKLLVDRSHYHDDVIPKLTSDWPASLITSLCSARADKVDATSSLSSSAATLLQSPRCRVVNGSRPSGSGRARMKRKTEMVE